MASNPINTDTNTTKSSQLPPIRLVTTSHTPGGLSIFASDHPIAPFQPLGPHGSSFTTLDIQSRVPITIPLSSKPSEAAPQTIPRVPPTGVSFGIVDFPAGARAPMHRTQSLDYAVVMRGEIVCGLDGGEERVLREGDALVQGGVNHEWINQTSEVCRVMFVMVGAEKIVTEDGKVLEETVFKK